MDQCTNDGSYDVIVVGAGVFGLWTAKRLAERGSRVLLLEQFQFPHKRGSSGEAVRICQVFNETDNLDMVLRAVDDWKELEKRSGKTLLLKTGCLWICSDESKLEAREVSKILASRNIDYEILSKENLRKRFPMIALDDVQEAMLLNDAYVLLSARCNMVLLEDFKTSGGIFQDLEKVQKIEPGVHVKVITNLGCYEAPSIVLTPGPWLYEVLKGLDLEVPIKTLPALPCYWKEKVTGDYSNARGMPIVVEDLSVSNGYQFMYAFPSYEYPGMIKIGTRGEPALEVLGPDDRDRQDRNRIIRQLSDYVEKRFPGIESVPSIIEGCMYTMTQDFMFIIDRHPRFKNIVNGGGGSGRAYKFAPSIGKVLSQLVLNEIPDWDIRKFRLGRLVSTYQSPADRTADT